MKRYKWINSLLQIVLCVGLISCEQLPNNLLERMKPRSQGMEITKLSFSDDYCRINLKARLTTDLGAYSIDDTSQVDIRIAELRKNLAPCTEHVRPQLLKVENVGEDEIKEEDLNLYVLVDLTQPMSVLAQQQEYVRSLHNLFSKDNLFLSFMLPEGKQSAFMPASNYVINNYIEASSPLRRGMAFDPNAVESRPYLYRMLLASLDTLQESQTPFIHEARYKALLLLSDGVTYAEDDYPLDPDHFSIQEQLIQQVRRLPRNIEVYYVNLKEEEKEPNNLIQSICMQSNGGYYAHFDRHQLVDNILSSFYINYDDYAFELLNPQDKLYFGGIHYLQVSCYTKADSLLATAYVPYALGSLEQELIIGNQDLRIFTLRGVLVGLLVMLLAYLVLQFVLPFVYYQLFRRRYVVSYQGPRMSVGEIPVPEQCYLCKAPFQPGERIVAKCKHVMHEECWEENGYHCPEHGHRCPEGAHYYNRHNLFDRRNASFYLPWLLYALAAGILAWACYVVPHHVTIYRVLDNFISFLLHQDFSFYMNTEGMVSTEELSLSPYMYHLPVFGFYLSLFLTMALSWITVYRRAWQLRLGEILLRALAASFITFGLFAVECGVVVVSDFYESSLLFDLIFWSLVAGCVAFASTYRTRLRPHKEYLLYACGAGFVSTFFWCGLGDMENVSQLVLLILAYLVFAGGIAVSIAKVMPRRAHYFLHVSGAIKEMDIALYKWFSASPHAAVTIGKSVSCSLQITWDLQSDISPIQAEIRLVGGGPTLFVLDGSVYRQGQSLRPHKAYRLHHGDCFQIGQTQFRFLES